MWIALFEHSDWLLSLGIASAIHLPTFFCISHKKETILSWLTTGLVYTKTIIHLSVNEEWWRRTRKRTKKMSECRLKFFKSQKVSFNLFFFSNNVYHTAQ